MSVIVVHIVAFATIMMFKNDWTSPSQRFDFASVLLPITAAYLVAIVKNAIDEQFVIDTTAPVNAYYVSVVLSVTASFLFAILFVVFEAPGEIVPTVETARQWLVLLDVGLGAAFGYIASDLFGKSATPPRRRPGKATINRQIE
jgi:hypothetical protein